MKRTARRTLPTREAAAFLGVAPATIRDWSRQGLVRAKARNAWDLHELRAAQLVPKPRDPRTRDQGADT